MILTGKPKYLEKGLFQYLFVHCKFHVDWPRIDFHCERLVNNSFSYDMTALW
jgi:hypothetical protein